ncbi:YbbR domain-containing protein [Pedobacter sp. UYP30]|uniref:YbbR-like domain-containing protein n=1 Tax=Pedobacter sp. UYP30 TaxID=1756400 RepID=UPI0033990118
MAIIKLTKIEKRRVVGMFACLCFAIAAWLFMALNNKYVYNAKTVLTYKNFPSERAFHPLQSDTVDLQVEGSGWQLLFSRLRIKPQSISVNLEPLNKKDFIVFSNQINGINRQFASTQKIISIRPDTLYFDFTKRSVKKVPINLIKKISYANQFGLANDILLTPKYVTVTGPLEDLRKIKTWDTDTLLLNNLSNSASVRVGMQQTHLKNINIYPSIVEVKIPVDEFTEKTIEVPLKIINNKGFNSILLFPKKVKVTFLVTLGNYNQVDENFIQAAVDVGEWKNDHHNQFTVKITDFPDYCKLVSVVPNKVDFIVEK